jgi:hypothetical protein
MERRLMGIKTTSQGWHYPDDQEQKKNWPSQLETLLGDIASYLGNFVQGVADTAATANALVKRDGNKAFAASKIYGLAAPDGPDVAANKAYVDGLQPADTGWVNVPTISGFTGTNWQVRKIGLFVCWHGTVTPTEGGNFATANTTVGTLPDPKFAPMDYTRIWTGGYSGANANGTFVVLTPGSTNIQIGANGASYGSAYFAHIVYLGTGA